jgi:hypothetical protein
LRGPELGNSRCNSAVRIFFQEHNPCPKHPNLASHAISRAKLVEEKHNPRWFTSDEMKQRATVKVDVAGIQKNPDVDGL